MGVRQAQNQSLVVYATSQQSAQKKRGQQDKKLTVNRLPFAVREETQMGANALLLLCDSAKKDAF